MEEAKALTHEDPQFLPVQYSLTEERLAELAKEYDPDLIPEAVVKGDDGYLVVHEKAMAIVKVRSNIENVRKDLKKDSLAWGKKVDTEAKRLNTIIEKLEAPWKALKLELDTMEAVKAAAAADAEQERQELIELAISSIRNLAEGLIGATAEAIQKRIDELKTVVVTEEKFGEYVEAGKLTGDITMKALTSALEERQAFEASQAVLKEEQAALITQQAAAREAAAEQQAELDAQAAMLAAGRKELADAQAAVKASEDAAKAAEEVATRKEQEAKEAVLRTAAKAEADKKDLAKMKKRLPQDKEAREFAERLSVAACSKPDLKDPDLKVIVQEAVGMVLTAALSINTNTQGGASS
jgi:hypothetical protein